ncbi:ATP-dependent RNA helicase HrpA [Devriesea agamarum]|uniref:ATP-dependent RNA helicase HrpA n=1 Tax=Devriesea agamarum TaxID=472569 RepID=UPI00071C9268|nr:ATP-dependent RNA helicase HrpA [Devriesea agamarum]
MDPISAPLRITYPDHLPVSARREDIMQAIRDHQVVVIAGETGSGKTTQLPKMCLELGRGSHGKLIGHTQPRRIAARSVAQRISAELGEKLGDANVGYQVRFTRQVAKGARLKLMTDGILLAEIAHDRLLRRYDTLIIDEAHERSLNIDVILGYLRRILPKRPDLKVIVTSATIDPERFSRHFAVPGADGTAIPAPIIEVSGRTYPVEVRYRPLVVDAQLDQLETSDPAVEDVLSVERDETQAVCDAVDELAAEGPGDILVFLPGEREIREIADALGDHLQGRQRASAVEILPLFGRLSAADQEKIFSPKPGAVNRRIVLATNVAETSLTVPGITYVIDSGLARISRYSQRTKVQRLPIEPISQASANQRSGRCGRTEAGIAIRLYSEEDFNSRPEFTEPEILRTSLASVVLQMTALGLGDIDRFPFVESPDKRAVADGLRVLHELGAIVDDRVAPGGRRLTDSGQLLARFPLDVRMARMLIEAERLGCLREVLIIVAGLAIQDPRERPLDAPERAKQLHARFSDEASDFLAYLNLWNHVRERRRILSNSALKRELREEYLHYLRIREWWDLHAQLKEMAADAGLRANEHPAGPDAIHQALLSGLLSHVGLYEERYREYHGARGAKFAIWPGSALAKKRPDYVMAAELVETSRLWARSVARIDPAWIERAGSHVVKRSYSQPHWSSSRASAMAHEKVTLFGVPIVADRVVSYGAIDPEVSRDLFIRHALIDGEWNTRHHFVRDNARLLERMEELEHKTRRRGLIADDAALFDFYDARIPQSVVSGRHFDSWWKKTRRNQPDLLTLTEDVLLGDEAEEAARRIEQDFPSTWTQGDITIPLTYSYNPGTHTKPSPHDGVTATVPLAVLNRLKPQGFDWLVPGMRQELITELIRTLPKPIRRHLVPAPERAKAVAAALLDDGPQDGETFCEAVADELVALPGVPDDLPLYGPEFNPGTLPAHLRMHFRVVDAKGREIGRGDDLAELQQRLKKRVKVSLEQYADSFARNDIEDFPLDRIPATYDRRSDGLKVTGYPALTVRGRRSDGTPRIDLAVLPTADEQKLAHREGLIALVDRHVGTSLADVLASLPNPTKLAVASGPYASTTHLLADASRAATCHLVGQDLVWDRDSFEELETAVAASHRQIAAQAVKDAASALAAHHRLQRELKRVTSLSVLTQLTQIRDHAASLVQDGFISATGVDHLPDLDRYLRASCVRLDKMQENPKRDAQLAWQLEDVTRLWLDARGKMSPLRRQEPDALAIPWMLEEFRVSLFAQTLGTKFTVSDQRIRKAIAAL